MEIHFFNFVFFFFQINKNSRGGRIPPKGLPHRYFDRDGGRNGRSYRYQYPFTSPLPSTFSFTNKGLLYSFRLSPSPPFHPYENLLYQTKEELWGKRSYQTKEELWGKRSNKLVQPWLGKMELEFNRNKSGCEVNIYELIAIVQTLICKG